MNRTCAMPGCARTAPGKHNDFCAGHFFMIAKRQTDLCRSYSVMAANAVDSDERQHLREQHAAHVHAAIDSVGRG